MADIVTSQTIADTSGVKFVVKLTNQSDGTGENLVKKIDASEWWCDQFFSGVPLLEQSK